MSVRAERRAQDELGRGGRGARGDRVLVGALQMAQADTVVGDLGVVHGELELARRLGQIDVMPAHFGNAGHMHILALSVSGSQG